jgi:DNA repair exonuclease SbcCD ATPase subunit
VPRKTEFSRALAEAKKRLKWSTKRKHKLETELAGLNAEIPALERTIRALEQQLGKKKLAPLSVPLNVLTDVHIPKELEQYVLPQDLSNFGSIPATQTQQQDAVEVTEDELLPDPDGRELTKD